jgi:hypothetical protein
MPHALTQLALRLAFSESWRSTPKLHCTVYGIAVFGVSVTTLVGVAPMLQRA